MQRLDVAVAGQAHERLLRDARILRDGLQAAASERATVELGMDSLEERDDLVGRAQRLAEELPRRAHLLAAENQKVGQFLTKSRRAHGLDAVLGLVRRDALALVDEELEVARFERRVVREADRVDSQIADVAFPRAGEPQQQQKQTEMRIGAEVERRRDVVG